MGKLSTRCIGSFVLPQPQIQIVCSLANSLFRQNFKNCLIFKKNHVKILYSFKAKFQDVLMELSICLCPFHHVFFFPQPISSHFSYLFIFYFEEMKGDTFIIHIPPFLNKKVAFCAQYSTPCSLVLTGCSGDFSIAVLHRSCFISF